LESTRLAQLRTHPDEEVRFHAGRVLPPPESLARRAEVVEAYRGALDLRGDAAKGLHLFKLNCAQCHKVGDMGHVVGPDLANSANGGMEKLLVNILDPNREVNPQYLNYVIDTKDWETFSGIIVSETATSVTVARANGLTDTILRGNIESIRSADLSLMPEGWEVAFKPQDMANLLAYLMSLAGGVE
jgi:putative heme-binding domain-containing protein